jgi:hypothetical protein
VEHLRQELRVFWGFVAKDCESRKEVGRNNGDYLDSAVFRLNFAVAFGKIPPREQAAPQHRTSSLHSVCTILASQLKFILALI